MPVQDEKVQTALKSASGIIADAIQLIITSCTGDLQNTVIQVMRAFRKCCRAQEQLYSVRRAWIHLNHHFFEPGVYQNIDRLDPESPAYANTGLHHIGVEEDLYARGAVSLYVPESYDGARALPLVVALHGGFGHGRDFIWTWLREARSRCFILLAPSSKATTWSLLSPEEDGAALLSMLDYVKGNWRVDLNRVLLTGISDGATFALLSSLHDPSPFTAFAPIAGVLPPINPVLARGKRIYWVHGALDWMFPVHLAQTASNALKSAGADITLRVIEDLSHTYPREANDRILTWFDPDLALR